MSGNQSNNLNPNAGEFTPNSSPIAPSFPGFEFPVHAPPPHNQMNATGNGAFPTVAPTPNGWPQMNRPHHSNMPMGFANHGQHQRLNYPHRPGTPMGYPAQRPFPERNNPHYPERSMVYAAPGQHQRPNIPSHAPFNQPMNGFGQTGYHFQNQQPGMAPMVNPLFHHSHPAVAPDFRGPVPPPTPAGFEPLGRNMRGFNQMANPLFNQSMPATQALYDPSAPDANGRRSLPVANNVASFSGRDGMAGTIYVYQPLPAPTPSSSAKPSPTPAQQSRESSMSSTAGGNGKSSDSGSDETKRNGRETNDSGRGRGKRGKGRGPPQPHQDLPLDAKDIVPGAIVWLHKPEPWHQEVLCVQNHNCVDPRKEPDGHNHPVLILRVNQKKGSDKIGDLVLDVAPMTTLHGVELDEYIRRIRVNGPDLSKNWFFALTMPLEHKSSKPSPEIREELNHRGNNFLKLSRGEMQRQSYVRVNHIYAVPLAQLQSCNRYNKPAHSIRLNKTSYNIVMSRLGLTPEPWEENVDRSVALAPQRLLSLRDNEIARVYASQMAENQGGQEGPAGQERPNNGQQSSLSGVARSEAKSCNYL